MKIIKDISNDIKCKMKEADRDIRKAHWYKDDYFNLSEKYYSFSVEKLDEAMDLHSEVVSLIEEYRKTEEPPSTMMILWDYEHKNIIEEVAEIKALQEFYKNM